MKKSYIPRTQDAYLLWHDNLKANVSAATPGATPTDTGVLATDNADLHLKMANAMNADVAAKSAHAALAISIGTSQLHARGLAQRIKKSTGYTAPLGETLKIIGEEDSTDMTTAKPTLTVTVKMNGVVEIGFNKMLAEGVHIYGLREGETVFTLLASATHSPQVDNRPLLVPGKPETRSYKAMFFTGKAEVGVVSDVATAIAAP